MKNLEKLFPFWSDLDDADKKQLEETMRVEKYGKGELIHRTDTGCKGILGVLSGQIRIYILSEEGREVTLFRIHENEVCVLSASCLLDSIEFDVLIEATEDTEVQVIQTCALNQIIKLNPAIELYLYKTVTENFSDVMWTMQQILFMRIDQRIAQFLWDEMVRKNSKTLQITHDEIAKHIGSAREVVTKVLKYLAKEEVVSLSRGKIEVISKEKLHKYL
ncbi:MAG: Crp/Fnr family transcriptional regulator [Tyzzerella sp.]|nr:Crp/Fnr family transcriptional regulator [Tyzzerella sp.]